MADANNYNQRSADTTQDLVVDGLPSCSIVVTVDGICHVVAQLAADEQAALAAAAPTPDDLCQRAQHALGLAGIGSRIDRAHTAVGIYDNRSGAHFGEPAQVLDGPAVLWGVAQATPAVIHALVAAATHAMRSAPDP